MVRSLPYADMDKMLSLSKRRGFVFQSSEIYGGLGSTWDYGPLGVELKRNVKEAWWRSVISGRDDMVGLDAAILMHPRTWEASGHVENFSDPLVECRECNQRFRQDHLLEDKGIDPSSPAAHATLDLRCPECGGELTEPRRFNLMFRTFMGRWRTPRTRSGSGRRRHRAYSSISRTYSIPPVASRPSASGRSGSHSATRSRRQLHLPHP